MQSNNFSYIHHVKHWYLTEQEPAGEFKLHLVHLKSSLLTASGDFQDQLHKCLTLLRAGWPGDENTPGCLLPNVVHVSVASLKDHSGLVLNLSSFFPHRHDGVPISKPQGVLMNNEFFHACEELVYCNDRDNRAQTSRYCITIYSNGTGHCGHVKMHFSLSEGKGGWNHTYWKF